MKNKFNRQLTSSDQEFWDSHHANSIKSTTAKEKIDRILFDLTIKIKSDKNGKIRYDDFHNAITDARIKIAKL